MIRSKNHADYGGEPIEFIQQCLEATIKDEIRPYQTRLDDPLTTQRLHNYNDPQGHLVTSLYYASRFRYCVASE